MLRVTFTSLALSMVAASLVSGCVSNGGSPAANQAFARADAATVAFDSVDGPPPQVFERLVGALDSEAKLRGIAVVSRDGASTYRVRSYLSAHLQGKRTTIAWVWDVYDANQQRALRLSGRTDRHQRAAQRPDRAAASAAGSRQRPGDRGNHR